MTTVKVGDTGRAGERKTPFEILAVCGKWCWVLYATSDRPETRGVAAMAPFVDR